MKKVIVPVLVCALLATLSSCNQVKEKTKEAISKSGETVAEGAGEFINGVGEGVENTMECKVETSAGLTAEGVQMGKFNLPDSAGTQHVISVFISFDKAFKRKIMVSVFDEKDREYGRTSVEVESEAGEGKYVDFVFDKRTDIGSRSKFVFK